jgi:hypothetical protein
MVVAGLLGQGNMAKDGLAKDSLAKDDPAKDDRAIIVFTADTRETILIKKGSGDWVVSAKKADSCKYIICCRKPFWNNRQDGIEAGVAFLIGHVAGLVERGSANERDQKRYLIRMTDYAGLPDKPKVWKKGVRNPVAYATLAELGIDPTGLTFEPMPAGAAAEKEGAEARPMTLSDAKKGLAAAFGVAPEDIDITIRG